MTEPLRVLLVEDSESDALLVLRALRKAGFDPVHRRVEDPAAMQRALEAESWDLILSDYSMPQFSGPAALRLAQRLGVDLPFIVVSGTVGEAAAIETMRAGAHDYLMKASLKRLGEAVRREMEAARVRRQERLGRDQLRHVNQVLRAIRKINQLIVTERDPQRLVQRACDLLIETRGYDVAWIALDLDKSRPSQLGHAGPPERFEPFLHQLQEGWRPPCTEAIQTAEPGRVLVQPAQECGDCPLRRRQNGHVSLCAPIEHRERQYGLMGVAVPVSTVVGNEELSLLAEITGDLAFALHNIEASLQRFQREREYRTLFQSSLSPVFLLQADGTVQDANHAAAELCGRLPGDLKGQRLTDIVQPLQDLAPRSLEQALRAGEPVEAKCARGVAPKTVLLTAVPLKLREGTVLYCFGQNITERKRAEQALRRSEAALRQAQAVAHVGNWTWHIQSNQLEWSDEMYRIFGEDPRRFSGDLAQVLAERIHPDDREAVERSNRSVLEHNKPLPVEYRVVRPDGVVRTVWAEAGTLDLDPHGRPERLTGIVQDITERKQMQASLVQSDRLASMGLLAAGVAHEINNPLSYVLFNLESLGEDLPRLLTALADDEPTTRARVSPGQVQDTLERFAAVLDGAHRIRDIARGLATFSRVEQDELTDVDLHQVIDAAVSMSHNEVKYRAQLTKELEPVPRVRASEGRLSQVFLNLIINAAHAIEDGDVAENRIRVRTWAEQGQVCAEVRDTGGGINEENLAKIFDPFFTTKEIGVGSGLGLAISRNIVESYGGTIEVQSELGQGTSVVVRLPLPGAAASPQPEAEQASRPADGKNGRILLIDDDPRIRAAMARMLNEHEVVQAQDGVQAQEILAQDRAFDVILCDVMMPGLSGIDLHCWICEQCGELAARVVFMTGGAFTPRVRDYLGQVSNLTVEKPFNVEEFKSAVSSLLQHDSASAPGK